MFDLSWSEILVIGTAAIIFIGPKELPGALRTLGQWTAKARALAREFQTSVDDMIRESELEKIKTEVDKLGSGDLQRQIERTVDPEGEITKALNEPMVSGDPMAVSADEPAAPATEISRPQPEAPPVLVENKPAENEPAESKPAEATSSGTPQKPA